MSAITLTIFNDSRSAFAFYAAGDDIRIKLTSDTPTAADASPVESDYADVAGATSVSLGNWDNLFSGDNSGLDWDSATNPTFSGTGSATHAIIYNADEATDPAFAYVTLGATVDLSDGDLTLTWNASGLWSLTASDTSAALDLQWVPDAMQQLYDDEVTAQTWEVYLTGTTTSPSTYSALTDDLAGGAAASDVVDGEINVGFNYLGAGAYDFNPGTSSITFNTFAGTTGSAVNARYVVLTVRDPGGQYRPMLWADLGETVNLRNGDLEVVFPTSPNRIFRVVV